MSDPDWDLRCLGGFAGTKYYGPHPSTSAIGMMGPHQPGGPRAPKHVKTALHTWQFIFIITACIFSYSLNISF